ncbi:MAG TPA: hypothetical protein VH764_08250 [Gemmatimonadales bacterium]
MSRVSSMPCRASVAALLLLAVACRDEARLPSQPGDEILTEQTPEPEQPAAPEPAPEPTVADVLDNRSDEPGLVFGSSGGVLNAYLNEVHTGWLNGGSISPSNVLANLSAARAKGGRVVLKLCKGKDSYVKNSDGTFSLSKWKSLVSQYRNVNLGPYINDGTIIGHYLIDEPHRAQRWGGKGISYSTLEEMAKFSKSIWPDLNTMVRVTPSWLAGASFTWKYVDAGWTQYRSTLGDPGRYIKAEAEAARREGLGLVVGLNVLDGGNGSSKIRGYSGGKWAMSASEIRNYGSAMLAVSEACAFFNWTYDGTYYNRSDIKGAMADVSSLARRHAKTSCRQ